MRAFDCHEMELMDLPQPVNGELKEALHNLEWLNRYLGGHRYLHRFLDRHLGHTTPLRILDLATGGGDFPRIMVAWARARHLEIRVDAIDQNPATIEFARQFSEGFPEITFLKADALRFDPNDRYDLVHSSLSLHHFSTDQAVTLLRRCAELSTQFVLITDLERALVTRLGVHLINRLLGHNRMTIEDGDTSARRAFSFAEFRGLAEQAGWAPFHHERVLLCRQALWKKIPPSMPG